LYANPDRKLEIFENEFIEKYSRLIEIVLGTVFMHDEERYPLKHLQEEKPRLKSSLGQISRFSPRERIRVSI
jgi:hypothetical protein